MRVTTANGVVTDISVLSIAGDDLHLVPGSRRYYVENSVLRSLGYQQCSICRGRLSSDNFVNTTGLVVNALFCPRCGGACAVETRPDYGGRVFWDNFATLPNFSQYIVTHHDPTFSPPARFATVGRYLAIQWQPAAIGGLYPLGLLSLAQTFGSHAIVAQLLSTFSMALRLTASVPGVLWASGAWQFVDTNSVRLSPRFGLPLSSIYDNITADDLNYYSSSIANALQVDEILEAMIPHLGTEYAPNPDWLERARRKLRDLGIRSVGARFDAAAWALQVEKDLGPIGPIDKILRRKAS